MQGMSIKDLLKTEFSKPKLFFWVNKIIVPFFRAAAPLAFICLLPAPTTTYKTSITVRYLCAGPVCENTFSNVHS